MSEQLYEYSELTGIDAEDAVKIDQATDLPDASENGALPKDVSQLFLYF